MYGERETLYRGIILTILIDMRYTLKLTIFWFQVLLTTERISLILGKFCILTRPWYHSHGNGCDESQSIMVGGKIFFC